MAMACGLSQQSSDACGDRSNLSSAMWSIRRHGLLQLSTFLTDRPQKLKLHSRKVFFPAARMSSPATFEPISHSPCQNLREKTSLEFISPSSTSYRIAERWVCAGGGKRPRKPRIWRTQHRRGSFSKSDKLIQCLESVSNVKEEVYGALDGFIAWELDFPLVAVKKALYVLQGQRNWARIIQVVKWMLGKGQGRTLGTYGLLLKALSEEGRIDEAQELWKKVFSKNMECTPIKLFVEVMRMYKRYEMYEDLLEVFADMEELNVKLNNELANVVSETYEKLGSMDKAEKVRQKYVAPMFRWRRIEGRTIKFRNTDALSNRGVSRYTREGYTSVENQNDAYGNVRVNDLDGKVEEEDWRDYSTGDDEEFQREGDEEELEVDYTTGNEEEFQMDASEEALQVEMGHFHLRQSVANEVYM